MLKNKNCIRQFKTPIINIINDKNNTLNFVAMKL